jgi:hypothetical protein
VQWLGFFLLFLGGSAAPRLALFIAALVLYAGYCAWRQAATPRERWNTVIRWVTALLVTGFLFLLMIDFRVSEFLRLFHYHAAGRISKDKLWMIKTYFMGYLGYFQWPLVALPFVLLIWSLRKPKDYLSRTAFCLAAITPIAVYSGGLGSGTAWWAFLVMVLLAGSLVKTISRRAGIILQVAIFLILAVINRKIAAESLGIITGHITKEQGDIAAVAQKMRPTREHPILTDAWAARYLYDYHLPEGMLDAEWSVRFPGAGPGAYTSAGDPGPQLRKGDIYVVSFAMRKNLQIYTLLQKTKDPTWKAFGLSQLAFEPNPHFIYIIPSEDCKDVRPGAANRMPGS